MNPTPDGVYAVDFKLTHYRMKVYLDTNVVSAIARDDTPSESDALDRLMAAYEQNRVSLVTSAVTLNEIARLLEAGHREPIERIFRLFENVPVVSWGDELLRIDVYEAPYTFANIPVIQKNPLFASLLELGLEVADAQHLLVAATQDCTLFLTCDGGVLHRAGGIRERCGLAVQRPSDLVASEGWVGGE